ncbi:MAG: MarP family serine protease [Nocardioides sp.]
MNLLDWLLVALMATYALSGYWQGFITGAAATLGLLAGGIFGIWLAPIALGDAQPSIWVSLGALFIVILAASLGQAIGQFTGARLREAITWQPIRAVDAVGGALLSAGAVLIVAWALGLAISGSRIGAVTTQVRNSTILAEVNGLLPDEAGDALRGFTDVVGSSVFPRYLEPFARERIVQVSPGPQRMLTDPDVTGAEPSVLKISGVNRCGRGIEGSGFVYADNRVMTNAHVVAGVSEPSVWVEGREVTGSVVLYDPELDIAVIAVDDGGMPRLALDTTASPRDPVAVLGYPQDGPFRIETARVRSQQRLRSPDIYGNGSVLREVFALRASVRPGNSGGPVLSSQGDVVGMVFAASVTDSETGYALTADQLAQSAALGLTNTKPANTGRCTM